MSKKGSAPQFNMNEARSGQDWAAKKTAESARYGMQSGGGNVKWTPDGYVIEDSEQSQRMRELQGGLLGGVTADPSQISKDYYDSVMSMRQPSIDEQRRTETLRLEQQGIPVGSEAYNRAMGDFDKNIALTNNNLAQESVMRGQQYQQGQLQNIGMLGQQLAQGSPMNQYQAGIGSYNYSDPYAAKFQSDMQNYQQKQAGHQAMMGTLGTLAGAGIGAVAGSPRAGASIGGQAGKTV